MPKLGKNSKLNWTKFSEAGVTALSTAFFTSLNTPGPNRGSGRRTVLELKEDAVGHEDWNEAGAWVANFRSLNFSMMAVFEGDWTAYHAPVASIPGSVSFYKGRAADLVYLEDYVEGDYRYSGVLTQFFKRVPFHLQTTGIPEQVTMTARSVSLRAGEGFAVVYEASEHLDLDGSVATNLVWDFSWWSTRNPV